MAYSFEPSVQNSVFSPDQLIAGSYPLVTDTITLVSGQNLTRGAMLGIITASGKYTLSASAAGDGSGTPVAILAEDTNATGGDTLCPVYLAGEFDANYMTFGAGWTAAAAKAALRDSNVYIKIGAIPNTIV
jgi:hypothetical protein